MSAFPDESVEQRIQRVLRDEVAIVPYDPAWPEAFRCEKAHLLACLPRELVRRVEHFGSTAVPGLAAKPIVDVLVEVTDLEATRARVAPILEAQGYDYFWRPTHGDDGPPWYAWFIKRDPATGARTHHVHMVEASFTGHWDRLLFRDHLIAHPKAARDYEALKRRLASESPHDRVAYTQGKTAFIVAVTEQAKRSGARRRTLAAAAGLAAAALALLVPLLGGRAEPGYSHAAQFISELGADGAAHPAAVAAAGFAPIGALVLVFLSLLAGLLPRSRATRAGLACLAAVGAAYVVSALFPCDAGCPGTGSGAQTVHNLFGVLEYAGAVVGLLLLGAGLRASPRWRALALAARVAAALVGAGFVAMLLPELAPLRGLAQRAAEAAIFGWIAATSVQLLRSGRAAA